ncbi:MAG TPA: serine hydrolase [Stellaceae bacterium]|jgi:CubicO group peptidase (beta-lactamase class C family)
MRLAGGLVVWALLTPTLAWAAVPGNCAKPAATADGWPVASPEAKSLDPARICTIGPSLKDQPEAEAHGVVIARQGTLVYEDYFTGGIEYGADTLHDIRSISKSVTALLIGIALDHGWLKSVDAPVFSFFPTDDDLRTPDKDRITIANLLSMTSGLDWPESAVSYNNPSNMDRQVNAAPDPYRFVLGRPLAAAPGTMWNYNSGGVELLGDILKQVSRRPLDQFAKEALFDPLGIKDWEWQRSENGTFGAAGGLWLRPRDLAKIGQLVLNRGTWNGRHIVSAAWIDTMTARHSPPGWLFNGGETGYGYLWWRGRATVGGHDADWVGGIGWGGQYLYVLPRLDLVVAVNAGVYRRSDDQTLAGETALRLAVRAAEAQ